jgi:hypothetical protein
MRVVLLALALLLCGCPPAPVPPKPPVPVTDGGTPRTPCEAACLTLASYGCPEGQQADCVTVFAHVDGSSFYKKPNGQPLRCIDVAAAASKSEVQGLGVACP